MKSASWTMALGRSHNRLCWRSYCRNRTRRATPVRRTEHLIFLEGALARQYRFPKYGLFHLHQPRSVQHSLYCGAAGVEEGANSLARQCGQGREGNCRRRRRRRRCKEATRSPPRRGTTDDVQSRETAPPHAFCRTIYLPFFHAPWCALATVSARETRENLR